MTHIQIDRDGAVGVITIDRIQRFNALDVETARPLIAALPNQQRTVLTLRFFENMSQSQIGERMGYSQMHISRLLAKALHALRSQAREPDLAVTA